MGTAKRSLISVEELRSMILWFHLLSASFFSWYQRSIAIIHLKMRFKYEAINSYVYLFSWMQQTYESWFAHCRRKIYSWLRRYYHQLDCYGTIPQMHLEVDAKCCDIRHQWTNHHHSFSYQGLDFKTLNLVLFVVSFTLVVWWNSRLHAFRRNHTCLGIGNLMLLLSGEMFEVCCQQSHSFFIFYVCKIRTGSMSVGVQPYLSIMVAL